MSTAAITAIVRRDFLRLLRSPVRTALLFSVPLLMALLMAFAFGGSGPSQVTLEVLVWDEDDTLLTRLLRGVANGDGRLAMTFVGEDGPARMDRGEASALLHIPAGFTADYLAGRPTTLNLIQNPAERFLPRVAEEGARLGTVVLDGVSRVFRRELESIGQLADRDSAPNPEEAAALAAGITATAQRAAGVVFPPAIRLETVERSAEEAAEPSSGGSSTAAILAIVFPGLAVLGVLFLTQATTRDVAQERSSGQLQTLLAAPLDTRDYLAGKLVSVVTVTVAGFLLLVAIGLAMGIRWGPPLAVLSVVVATALAASGILLVISSLGTSERAQDTLATLVIMVGSLVGGSFVPQSQLPDFLRPIGRLSVNHWAVDAFNTLIHRDGGLADILVHLGILGGGGLLLLTIAARRLHVNLRSGAV